LHAVMCASLQEDWGCIFFTKKYYNLLLCFFVKEYFYYCLFAFMHACFYAALLIVSFLLIISWYLITRFLFCVIKSTHILDKALMLFYSRFDFLFVIKYYSCNYN
jgi:hypothetical protein